MDFLVEIGGNVRIGIDVDNIITDTVSVVKQYCKKYHDEVIKRNTPMKENGFASYNLYDWTKEENDEFCIKYLQEIVLQAKVKENAKEVIKRLKQEGHYICIITARTEPYFKNPYEITEKFLIENGIEYDKLVVGTMDKKQVCMENHIDIMLDDEPQYIIPIALLIPVITFDVVYNKECEGNNIIKVKTWDEAYTVIKQIEKKGR